MPTPLHHETTLLCPRPFIFHEATAVPCKVNAEVLHKAVFLLCVRAPGGTEPSENQSFEEFNQV